MTDRLATVAPLCRGGDLRYHQGAGMRAHPLAGEVLEDVAPVHNALEATHRCRFGKAVSAEAGKQSGPNAGERGLRRAYLRR